eukprot:155560-Prorocentrum_minimum.AAC.1
MDASEDLERSGLSRSQRWTMSVSGSFQRVGSFRGFRSFKRIGPVSSSGTPGAETQKRRSSSLKKNPGWERKKWKSAISRIQLTNQKTRHTYDKATVAAAISATKVGIVVSLVSGLRAKAPYIRA